MDIKKYEILLDAIESGSVTNTAERMNYTQSGLSHMLNNLEQELGVKLVIRDRNGVRPTSIGKTLMPYIRKIVDENERFMQALGEASGVMKGDITLGSIDTVSTVFLPGIIGKFKEKYPDIDFAIKNGSYEDNEGWIKRSEVDCGFIMVPTEEQFNYIPIISDRYVLVSGKKYNIKFKNPKAVSLKELEKLTLISADDLHTTNCLEEFKRDSSDIKFSITTQNIYSAIKFLNEIESCCIMPISLAEEFLDSLNVYELEKEYLRTIAFAYGDQEEMSPVTKIFVAFVKDFILGE